MHEQRQACVRARVCVYVCVSGSYLHLYTLLHFAYKTCENIAANTN